MTRNMDLIRELLLKLEALPLRPGSIVHITPDAEEVQVEGCSIQEIDYHLSLTANSGLIDTGNVNPMHGIGFRCLTWPGHDLVDSIRNPEVWSKTKKGAAAAGGFTFDLLKDLAKGLLRKQVEEYTGIKL